VAHDVAIQAQRLQVHGVDLTPLATLIRSIQLFAND